MTSLTLRSRGACPSFIRRLVPAVILLTAQAAQAGPAPQPAPDPQTTPAPVADATTGSGAIEEVLVTGSRIPVPANLTATSPIQQVTAQDVTLSGKSDVIDILNRLPQTIIQAGADLGNNSNPLNTPGGVATVDLRGLGPQRTLVLVDGRRLGTGDPNTGNANPAPDINQIPAALVERIDVVTGGASAVYGSDAMAGVVNFIMKKNFQGVQIDGQYGFADHNSNNGYVQGLEAASGITPPTGDQRFGDKHDLSVILGSNFADGAGNATVYFLYHNQSPVPGSLLDFADCLLGTNATNDGYACSNSTNSNQFAVSGSQSTYSVVGNKLLPFPQAGSSPPATFNSNAYEYQQNQDTRYQGGFFSHYDIADYAKPYLEFSFMNNRTNEVVGPSGLFEGKNPFEPSGGYVVNCSNPFLSAQEQGVIGCTPTMVAADAANPGSDSVNLRIGRRNIEGGGREYVYEHTNYRMVAGMDGKFLDAWSYDVYEQYYYTTLFNSNNNFLNYQAIDNALQVTGTAANPKCISGGSCVPFNIFSQGGVTAAQLAYLYTPGTAYGTNSLNTAHADVTGQLAQYNLISPWAKDGVAVNAGFEHRGETLSFAPDGVELAGDLAGGSGASVAISKGYSVNEGFTEIRAPLAQNLSFVKDLSLDMGYRYSDYSTAGGASTYKFEVQYAPTSDVRFRYSYDRAIRAPNLYELYVPQSIGQVAGIKNDPCSPTLVNGVLVAATATFAQCQHTGVTAAQYGNGLNTNTIAQCVSNQCSQIIGGNPTLKPETADTWSLGLSFTPEWVAGLTGSIDYYHIVISGEVGAIPPSVILSGCLETGNPTYCSLIVRSPTDGSISGASVAGGGYIVQTSINTGGALVSGIDVQTNYRRPLGGWGTFTANFSGSWLQHSETTPYSGAHTFDCAGLFGVSCGNTVNPTWRHNLRLNWETPWKVLFSAQWRYIGSTGFDNNSSDPTLQYAEEGGYDSINAKIPAYNYLDLSAILTVWNGIQVRAGANNVFDKAPPVVPSDITATGSANTYPTYDVVGREVFMGFTAKF
jgi:outer membrane receptor protein involved in Fe transport